MRVSHVEVLAVALLCGLGMRDAAAADEIFGDGFDGPKWYIDADSDGYGNPAVFVRSATQPPGYVANALDCDDSNAVVYPGAADDPDGAFLDSNCDGIDGDIAKAVFVAPAGIDNSSCGSQANPCQSPAFAISRLDALHTQIYLQVGAYPGALNVGANASFYGGYDLSWQRGPVASGGPNAQIVGASAPMASYGVQSFAIYVAPGVQALFADVEVDAPLAVGQSGDAGLSSYSLYADNAIVEIDRALVNQADGANGGAGLAGVSASGTIADAGNGGPSVQQSVTCDSSTRGTGGAPSTNTCSGGRSVVAGQGGNGGTMDTSCSGSPFSWDLNATNGIPGQNAAYVSAPPLGLGGGGGVGGNSCGPAQVGFDGAVSDGSGGVAGSGSSIAGGIWFAKSGGGGTLGENGGGGGGGGGAGGCDSGTDSWGAGGGGGGAGGCAAPTAGSGGGGGGGSFGVFAVGGNIVVNGTTFNRGHGGMGGQGGATGQGEPGGGGGQGGPQTQGSPGAKGGSGGRGGIAGGGGGGQGGSVFAIYSLGSTVTSIANTFVGGGPGPGGSGGASVLGPAAGQPGQTGAFGDVGTCAAPGGC